MRLRLLAFASAADALGAREQELEVAPGTTAGALADELARRHAALAPLLPVLALAVGGKLAPRHRVLAEGDEVALLPPVSGG